ncbi:hypothetical protein C3747_14g343 [Trypanosoma cruzi]|uniref:Arrestin-like N-terminal domain-containing protein n=2 Tax=Trypanosoma cruzi TaxID=5693 RepID=Q4E5Y2_TRYCC|nr:hypothetical protein Tc00.1047053508153.1130 [Trypanosoma cruzi]EAO00259.1 hypothetical protein Tc00.1047053508153.1130 [Trypanosoma cruzi]PWV18231.1 hypothetical protein C3747_14g343 [Trypanosoma cruzi]RNC48923.1 hypothetical protein TcCL_NonESM01198 [Trypanosoma cruzi]|eukprot:XP_822110.1 hypothetical protein [Trypanosoma cruzi strain CL Brener]
MGVFNRDRVEVELTLHGGGAAYIPGSTLSGVVKVFVKKKILCRGIRLNIRGEEYAKVHCGGVVRQDTHIHYDRMYALARDVSNNNGALDSPSLLFPDSDDEVEADMRQADVLLPGTYTHMFELILPVFLPPSFDVRDSRGVSEVRTTYTAKVSVDITSGFDVKCIRKFYVLSAIPEMQRRQWMEERMKAALVSYAELPQYHVMERFLCPRQGRFVLTEVSISPTVVLMEDCVGLANSYGDNGEIRVDVRVFNDTQTVLKTVRVQIKNVVEMKLQDVKCVRRVNVGEPFIFSEIIHPGEERSFVASIRPPLFFPYSSLEPHENDSVDFNRYTFLPLIPPRKQKQYILYHQPLMNMVTSFVDSRCVVSVDFPGVNAKGTIKANNVLILATTVDGNNRARPIPCECDKLSPISGVILNNTYSSQLHQYDHDRDSDEMRSESPWNYRHVKDRTGIFPAYTAGNWNPGKEALT